MHADRKIKQQIEEQSAGPSNANSSTTQPLTVLASALKEATSEKDLLPYTKERQKQFTKLFLDLLSKIFLDSLFVIYSCEIQIAACPKKMSASRRLGRHGRTWHSNSNSSLGDGIQLWLISPFVGHLLPRKYPVPSGSIFPLSLLRGSWT